MQSKKQTSMNAEDNQDSNLNDDKRQIRSDEIKYQEQIQGTPFKIVGNTDIGYFLALGIYQISELRPTPEDVEDLLITEQWNIIATIAGIVVNREIKDMLTDLKTQIQNGTDDKWLSQN